MEVFENLLANTCSEQHSTYEMKRIVFFFKKLFHQLIILPRARSLIHAGDLYNWPMAHRTRGDQQGEARALDAV